MARAHATPTHASIGDIALLVCNAAAHCESQSCHHRLPHTRTWDCENTEVCFYVSPERETSCVAANVRLRREKGQPC